MQSEGGKELDETKQQIISLQKRIDTINLDGKTKDEQLKKVNAALATAHKNLEDKTKEISTLQEKHGKELQTVSDDYQKEIDALQGRNC
jgi:chromosome segregation ATPase